MNYFYTNKEIRKQKLSEMEKKSKNTGQQEKNSFKYW